MTDNVTLQAEGSVIAADYIDDGFEGYLWSYQKIDLGDDGSASPLADVVEPLVLMPTRTVEQRVISNTFTSVSPAYSVKDAVGIPYPFAEARRSQGSLVVESVTVIDRGQSMPQLDIVLFNSSITTTPDNTVFDPTDSALILGAPVNSGVVGVISIVTADWHDFTSNSVATKTNINLPVRNFSSAPFYIWGQIVARSIFTAVANDDIRVIVTYRQN